MDRKMNANELADKLNQFGEGAVFASIKLTDVATMLRQQQAEIADKKLVNDTFADLIKKQGKKIDEQQAEIDRLNYDMEGFKQNFFVSGFHLQIKMANEQLVKQQEQIDALKSELDRAVELYTDKAIENEALKSVVYWLKENRPEVWDDIQKWRKL